MSDDDANNAAIAELQRQIEEVKEQARRKKAEEARRKAEEEERQKAADEELALERRLEEARKRRLELLVRSAQASTASGE
jgi:hypothetical protein